ncbi:MAG: flagellar hook-basal body complex protein [Oscillospiraceae bacterium]|nr:flagellar hook-basal body complex protein [Oscillospiraceae bacterium]MCI2034472.1 flagellar hook-basal body complex protein [Oscillospiraceae bacterium]
MMRCMTSAIAGLKAHQTAMDVVGNNIANVNTNSFKSSSTSFRDTMYQQIAAGSAGDANRAGVNPSQIGYGATAAGVTVDNTKGGENATGKNNDVYIDGEGYLIIGDGAKGGTDAFPGYKYTRVGELSVDSQGYLTDGNGNYVCGQTYDGTNFTPAYGAGVQPVAIKLPANAKDTAIGSDGTITCNVGGTVATVGRIGVATFTNASGLEQVGGSYYRTTNNAGTTTYNVPGSGSSGGLVTGALESSNVDLATEFSNMIVYERGYQANTKIISVADEMLQSLVNMK